MRPCNPSTARSFQRGIVFPVSFKPLGDLFALVITALTATSAGLALGLSAPELGFNPLRLALAGAALTAALVAYEMLTKDGVTKYAATGLFVTAFITMLVLDIAA